MNFSGERLDCLQWCGTESALPPANVILCKSWASYVRQPSPPRLAPVGGSHIKSMNEKRRAKTLRKYFLIPLAGFWPHCSRLEDIPPYLVYIHTCFSMLLGFAWWAFCVCVCVGGGMCAWVRCPGGFRHHHSWHQPCPTHNILNVMFKAALHLPITLPN